MGLPGSRRTVERLVDEHYVSLYRYAYRLSGNGTDAEDLTQETFCTAQLKLGQLRKPDRVKSWLFTILRHAYLHRIRADKHQHFVPVETLGEVAEAPPDPLPCVEPERLQEALNELPEVFRTPIILYYFEDFSYRDIAEQMELPIGTVMSRLARAKAHLRGRLLPAVSEVGAESKRRANDGL
jgi:RNA polymerase sigma-70 factor (ECF subfamily)